MTEKNNDKNPASKGGLPSEPTKAPSDSPKSSVKPAATIGMSAVEWTLNLSRAVAICSVLLAMVAVGTLAAKLYLVKQHSYVAAIPAGHLWDYPMVHWVNSPSQYDEDAKPFAVALKYIRAMYEVDTTDFQSVDTNEKPSFRLNDRLKELLHYVVQGTPEYQEVAERMVESVSEYEKFLECQCSRLFLIDDMVAMSPPTGVMVVTAYGRFYQTPHDDTRRLEAEYLSTQKITLHIAPGEPMLEATKDGIRKYNPEGWYVIKSQRATVSDKEIKELRKLRVESGFKMGY